MASEEAEASQEFKSLQTEIQNALVSTIKSVTRVASEDLSFQRTINPDVAQRLDDSAARILSLSNRLLASVAGACSGVTAPRLEDQEDIDLRWQQVVDVVDAAFERADRALDEFTGIVKRKDPPTSEANSTFKKTKTIGSLERNYRNANIAKPQRSFEVAVDNFTSTPWKPILTQKPHASTPLDESVLLIDNEDGSESYRHPYEAEITGLPYPDRIYHHTDPIMHPPLENTKAIWVDTFEGVLEMLEELKQSPEIAIDLEHHDFRTYYGLTCLMQISNRTHDWIIDTLKPWRHQLEVLNEVFADPSIIKVLHGAFMDVKWLQRDFGLYLNGYFDTGIAAEILGYPHRSLAYLLKKFVDFDADKKYQLADWRIRPLPEEMFFYAQSDTHFLLYIFDMMRNELADKSDRSHQELDYIGQVLEKSKDMALTRYERLTCEAATGSGVRGWYNNILKYPHPMSGEQFSVFRAVWKWRDEAARMADESPAFVMSQQTVFEISRVLPPDLKALISLIPPHSQIARSASQDIWKLIQNARTAGATGPSLFQFLTSDKRSTGSVSLRLDDTVADVSDTTDITPAPRFTKSQLFGEIALSTAWDDKEEEEQLLDDGYMKLPWQRRYPSLVGTTEEVSTPAKESTKKPDPVLPVAPDPEPVDDEFTLKRGQKRARPAPSEETSEDSSDSEQANGAHDIAVEEDEATSSKEDDANADAEIGSSETPVVEGQFSKKEAKRLAKQKKKEKKERKEKKKKEKEKEKSKISDETPFDFSNAASVLHAKRSAPPEGTVANIKAPAIFDPYSRAGEDGPKGARKAPPINGGRSATFKK